LTNYVAAPEELLSYIELCKCAAVDLPMSGRGMKAKRLAIAGIAGCAVVCAGLARAADTGVLPPSAWIVDLGGYGVMQPHWLGSKRYNLGFRPIGDIRQAGDREWLPFPNDAVAYSFSETENFRAGPAGSFSLQSRIHGQDIDLRLGDADVNIQGGAFVEYYPAGAIRTRAEVLQGITGNKGAVINLSADYIWRPQSKVTLTFGPRAQIVSDRHASEYFSTQYALAHHNAYAPFRAEGGVLTSGAEFTSKYDWTPRVSTRLFLDYNQILGDAADGPRVNGKGAAEQVILGVGATYRFTIE
jgi:MipA family protein